MSSEIQAQQLANSISQQQYNTMSTQTTPYSPVDSDSDSDDGLSIRIHRDGDTDDDTDDSDDDSQPHHDHGTPQTAEWTDDMDAVIEARIRSDTAAVEDQRRQQQIQQQNSQQQQQQQQRQMVKPPVLPTSFQTAVAGKRLTASQVERTREARLDLGPQPPLVIPQAPPRHITTALVHLDLINIKSLEDVADAVARLRADTAPFETVLLGARQQHPRIRAEANAQYNAQQSARLAAAAIAAAPPSKRLQINENTQSSSSSSSSSSSGPVPAQQTSSNQSAPIDTQSTTQQSSQNPNGSSSSSQALPTAVNTGSSDHAPEISISTLPSPSANSASQSSKKEIEKQRKEEERKRKEDDEKRKKDEKKKKEEDERRKKEEEKQRKEDEKKKKEEDERRKKEEEKQRKEDEKRRKKEGKKGSTPEQSSSGQVSTTPEGISPSAAVIASSFDHNNDGLDDEKMSTAELAAAQSARAAQQAAVMAIYNDPSFPQPLSFDILRSWLKVLQPFKIRSKFPKSNLFGTGGYRKPDHSTCYFFQHMYDTPFDPSNRLHMLMLNAFYMHINKYVIQPLARQGWHHSFSLDTKTTNTYEESTTEDASSNNNNNDDDANSKALEAKDALVQQKQQETLRKVMALDPNTPPAPPIPGGTYEQNEHWYLVLRSNNPSQPWSDLSLPEQGFTLFRPLDCSLQISILPLYIALYLLEGCPYKPTTALIHALLQKVFQRDLCPPRMSYLEFFTPQSYVYNSFISLSAADSFFKSYYKLNLKKDTPYITILNEQKCDPHPEPNFEHFSHLLFEFMVILPLVFWFRHLIAQYDYPMLVCAVRTKLITDLKGELDKLRTEYCVGGYEAYIAKVLEYNYLAQDLRIVFVKQKEGKGLLTPMEQHLLKQQNQKHKGRNSISYQSMPSQSDNEQSTANNDQTTTSTGGRRVNIIMAATSQFSSPSKQYQQKQQEQAAAGQQSQPLPSLVPNNNSSSTTGSLPPPLPQQQQQQPSQDNDSDLQ